MSIDPATGKMGIAIWENNELIDTFIVQKYGTKGKYKIINDNKKEIYNNYYEVIHTLIYFTGIEYVFAERGFGARANVVNAQAHIRGYINAICDVNNVVYTEVKLSSWRRGIKDLYKTSWPRTSLEQKALACKLVKEKFNIDVSEDEADAILIGQYAILSRLVPQA